jgi:hypothetical protein
MECSLRLRKEKQFDKLMEKRLSKWGSTYDTEQLKIDPKILKVNPVMIENYEKAVIQFFLYKTFSLKGKFRKI